MITVTDIFAGAGGSSTGAAQVPGLHVAEPDREQSGYLCVELRFVGH